MIVRHACTRKKVSLAVLVDLVYYCNTAVPVWTQIGSWLVIIFKRRKHKYFTHTDTHTLKKTKNKKTLFLFLNVIKATKAQACRMQRQFATRGTINTINTVHPFHKKKKKKLRGIARENQHTVLVQSTQI